jgi:hypothetical protein
MNGMCIPDQYFLDGEYDCMDLSDEKQQFNDLDCPFQLASLDSHSLLQHVAIDVTSFIFVKAEGKRSFGPYPMANVIQATTIKS